MIGVSDGSQHETEFDLHYGQEAIEMARQDSPTSFEILKQEEADMELRMNEMPERPGYPEAPDLQNASMSGGELQRLRGRRPDLEVPGGRGGGTRPGMGSGSTSAYDSIEKIGQDVYRRELENPTPEQEPVKGELEILGQRAYSRELRRSPADGTFRPQRQWMDDWEGFVNALPRSPRQARDNTPSGWGEVEADPRADHEIREQRSKTQPVGGSLDFKVGDKEGHISYTYRPKDKQIYIHWMGAKDYDPYSNIDKHELGASKVQELFLELALRHPEAETIAAYRVSGARTGHPKRMVRKIPRELINEYVSQ